MVCLLIQILPVQKNVLLRTQFLSDKKAHDEYDFTQNVNRKIEQKESGRNTRTGFQPQRNELPLLDNTTYWEILDQHQPI